MLQLPLPHDKCASRLQSQVHEFTNKRRSSSHNASKATVALCLDRELKLRKNPNLRVISRVQESHLRHYTSLAERSFQETEFRNSTTVSWPLNPVPVLSILMCLLRGKIGKFPSMILPISFIFLQIDSLHHVDLEEFGFVDQSSIRLRYYSARVKTSDIKSIKRAKQVTIGRLSILCIQKRY
jgi:hypothetical protein